MNKERKTDTQGRQEIIDLYLKRRAVILPKRERIKDPLVERIQISVVIPAFCEAETVPRLLLALEKQTYPHFEVIVVDNASSDDTVGIINDWSGRVSYPLYVLKESNPGAGNARKTGIDEVIRRVRERDKIEISHHFIAITDADGVPPPEWLFKIKEAFSSISTGVVSGTYRGAAFMEMLIEQRLGLSNYFGRIAELAYFLESNSIGRVRIRGLNSAFEIEAYCAAGGFEQPVDDTGVVKPRECEMLASKIRRLGYPIRSLGVTIEASQRRKLFELISGINSYFTLGDSRGRFVFVRGSEESLLNEALRCVSRESWIEYQREQLRTVVRNIILEPLVKREITMESLTSIIGEGERKELQEDLNQISDTELYIKWADVLVELSERKTLLQSA